MSAGRESGFTLLEMLVALAVFSLAAIALVKLQAVSVRSAADLQGRTMAELVARNIAFERMTDAQAPGLGESNGEVKNDGRNWRWTQTVTAMADPRLRAITVRVEGGLGQSPAVLSFVKRVP